MTFATIEDLRSQLGGTPTVRTPEYVAKMMHAIPKATTVDRDTFILERVKGKRVLEFGASGRLSQAIRAAASEYFGVDRQEDTAANVRGFDLDDVAERSVPSWSQTLFVRLDVIVCGEVLEHLSNPGWFLARLREQQPNVPVIITTPNAFSKIARKHAEQGTENVNIDHVSWYSPRTLRTLLERVGYTIAEFYFYGGNGPTASGLVVVTGIQEASHGEEARSEAREDAGAKTHGSQGHQGRRRKRQSRAARTR